MFSFMFFALPWADARILQAGNDGDCKFPFKLKGVAEEFNECTTMIWAQPPGREGKYWDSPDSPSWCPLEIDSEGYAIWTGKYKYCQK